MQKNIPFITITHLKKLEKSAQELINYAEPCKIWLFRGELGAGKTTLIKSICKQLGVVEHVASPTFALVNTYHLASGNPVYHIDLYRLMCQDEAIEIDVQFYFETGYYCFIEWPNKLFQALPAPHISITLTHHYADDSRKLSAKWVK